MPTGYTAEVADGKVTDFRTFALRCARAFGATVMQRDDPMDEPPKHREPSAFYAESLARAIAESERLAAITPELADVEAEAAYRKAVAGQRDSAKRNATTRQRYETMLADVKAWSPPTAEHKELKKFMVDQLTESLQFDCSYMPPAPMRSTGAAWVREQKQHAEKNIARYREQVSEEDQRVRQANEWIDALYASLQTEVSA